jgi:hypothetical protein
MLTKKVKEEEVLGVSRVKLTLEKFDKEGNSLGVNTFDNVSGIGLFKANEQPMEEGMRTEGIIVGQTNELRFIADALVQELEGRGLLMSSIPNNFSDLLNQLLGMGSEPETEDREEYIESENQEHDCARCAIRDFCPEEDAVEYRASKEYEDEDGNEGLN